MRRGELPLALLCAAAVAAVVLSLSLPTARAGCCLTPDAVGYLAVTHDWLEGAGFVEPILYTHYLPDARPPVPAFAIRPPGLSLLLAPPLLAGADVAHVLVWHAVWAALVAGAAVLAARRAMSLPAATGFAIAATCSPAWMFVATKPLTEVTAVGVLLLAVVSLRRGTASVRGALGFAALTLAAWAVRPNLLLVLPAAVLAVACERGPGGALRSRPLQVYVGACVLAYGAIVLLVEATTGFAPYAHYGVMAEIIRTDEVFQYGKQYVGWLAYLQSHGDEVIAALRSNLQLTYEYFFVEDFFLWVGWLALPGFAFALLRPGEGSLERRFVAFAGLGFAAVALATYGGFVARRYLLLAGVCSWFVVMSAASAVCSRLARRVAAAGGTGAPLAALPLALALVLFGAHLYAEGGTRVVDDPWKGWQDAASVYRTLCPRLDPDALVASPNPWWLYLWCGNAGLRLPTDLDDEAKLDRYLDEQQPGYLIAPLSRRWRFLRSSPRVGRIAILSRKGPYPELGVFEVLDAAPGSRPWKAPVALGARTP